MKGKFWKTGLILPAFMILTACGGIGEDAVTDGLRDVAGTQTEEQQTLQGGNEQEDSTVPDTESVENSETEPDVTGLPEDVQQGEEELEELTEEELMEYLMQFLPTASHKPEYTESIIDALAALPEEKPESSLKQRDVDCDTLQWFNATYAMFLESSGMDYHFIGGYDDKSTSDVDYIKNQLDRSWGITDRSSAINTLYWLALSGHAEGFAEDIRMLGLYGFLELSKEELSQALLDMVDGEGLTEEDAVSLAEYFIQEMEIYEACGENGIDAWDYCRFMQIAGSCYYAGYITLEESLSVQMEGARAIQQQFGSWDEMNQSYLQGYIFWVGNPTAAYIRERAYERLQDAKDSPFKLLDFQMSLEKFW